MVGPNFLKSSLGRKAFRVLQSGSASLSRIENELLDAVGEGARENLFVAYRKFSTSSNYACSQNNEDGNKDCKNVKALRSDKKSITLNILNTLLAFFDNKPGTRLPYPADLKGKKIKCPFCAEFVSNFLDEVIAGAVDTTGVLKPAKFDDTIFAIDKIIEELKIFAGIKNKVTLSYTSIVLGYFESLRVSICSFFKDRAVVEDPLIIHFRKCLFWVVTKLHKICTAFRHGRIHKEFCAKDFNDFLEYFETFLQYILGFTDASFHAKYNRGMIILLVKSGYQIGRAHV